MNWEQILWKDINRAIYLIENEKENKAIETIKNLRTKQHKYEKKYLVGNHKEKLFKAYKLIVLYHLTKIVELIAMKKYEKCQYHINIMMDFLPADGNLFDNLEKLSNKIKKISPNIPIIYEDPIETFLKEIEKEENKP